MPSLRAGIVFLLLVLMELLAGFSLVVGSGLIEAVHAGNGLFWLMLLAGLGGLLTGLGVAFVGPAEPWNRVLLLVGGALFAVTPALITGHDLYGAGFTVGVLIVAYWRGLRLSLEPADSEAVKREFGLGFGVVFLAFLWGISRDVDHKLPFWSLLEVTGIAFTVTAMVALVVARLERQREPGSGLAVFVAVAVQLGILILLAVGAIAVFGHDLGGAAGNATRPFFNAVGAVGYRAIMLLAGPIQWLIDLVRSHAHSAHPRITQPPNFGSGRTPRKRLHPGHANQTVLVVLGSIALTIALVVVSYIVWRLLPRIPRYRAPKGYEEERRNLLTPAQIARAILAWLLSLVRRTGAGMAEMAARTRRRIWGVYPEDPVRRVYAQLLRRSAAAGMTRPADATPDEFGRRLANQWPDVAFELGAITEAYVMRRYGDISAGADGLARLSHQWQQVRTEIRVPRTPLGQHHVEEAEPGVPGAADSPRARLSPAQRFRRALAQLNDPASGVRTTLLVWLMCALIPFVIAILLLLVLLLAHL